MSNRISTVIRAVTDLPARLLGGNAQTVEVSGLDYTLHLDYSKLPEDEPTAATMWTAIWDEPQNIYKRIDLVRLLGPAAADITSVTPIFWNMYTYGYSGTQWAAMRLLRAEMPGAHPTNDLSLMAIEARPLGSGKNGPASADFGLSISTIKKDYDTATALPGEIDGINVVLRNGGVATPTTFDDRADSAAYMFNAQILGQSGYVSGLEGVVSTLSPPGPDQHIDRMCSVQMCAIDGTVSPTGVGMLLNAVTGTMDHAIYVQHLADGNWTNFLHFHHNVTGFNYLTVTGTGKISAGNTTASTSSTTGAMTLAGGLGVAGAGYFGEQLVATNLFLQNGGAVLGYGKYIQLNDGDGSAAFIAGGVSDPANVHRNTTHLFQPRDGSASWARFNSAGLEIYQTTVSASPTTGALIVAGGVGVGGALVVAGTFRLAGRATAPSSPVEGDTYYDNVLHMMRTWDGTVWRNHW